MIRVLIVDDNKALTGLIKEMLETEGIYHVKTAENGENGYVAFHHFKPDIILTDIEMPVKNGLEMVRNIRLHYSEIKAIYMSGDFRRYRTFLDAERTRYQANLLKKPFSFSRLIEVLDEYKEEEVIKDEEAYAY
ncbi:response regulator [Thermodesulfobacteriota bacterium]